MLRPSETAQFPARQPITTFEDAERAAETLRAAWHLDDHPIENLIGTIEDHGGIVVEWIEETEAFNALSGWGNQSAPIIVINRNVVPDRLRFNVAHELGHLCMGSSDMQDADQEKLVNRFAAAFLVPSAVARRELSPQRQHIDWLELGIL